ncbi:hypothetical protein OPQ81_003709 [Rhizoctonia solani]|nr:hypothetical protein OPQ81_003709 [Rhizoctonia solani]
MLNYFTQDLGVPDDRFLCLFDEKATRDAILTAFVKHLIENPAIKRHDPIVIYFAGHGDHMPAPAGWQTSDGRVEMILPHDASSLDEHGHYIYGIPDLTLAFLLYKLSQAKGNNITVILDSCHSGSSTRDHGKIRSRNSHDTNAPPIPNELDGQVRRSLSVDYPSEVEHNVTSKQESGSLMAPSLETHVLLAACRENELALEIQDIEPRTGQLGDPLSGGVFTHVLLKELRRCDLATTSYTTLLRNLLVAHREYRPNLSEPLPPQTFQCEGRNQDRLLFSVQYSISKGKISLIQTSDRSVYRVRVGSAQGVVPGTEFGVFSSKLPPASPPIAVLVARDVGPTMSQLHGMEPNAPPKIPEDAYATIVKYNNHSNGVRIWVDERVKGNEMWISVLDGLKSLPIYFATAPGDHDMALLPFGQDVELRGAHLTPGRLEVAHTLKSSLGVKRLVDILTPVVYFHFHLRTQNPDAPVRAQLQMKLLELKEASHSWGSPIYDVKGEDLFGDNIASGTVAVLHPDHYKIFGLELINNSQENLFPYVLYYDFEDYSVGCLYEPPSRTVRAPLQAGKSLTIGYGSGGSQPFQVEFTRQDSEREYGAFVLLVFIEHLASSDISHHRGCASLQSDLLRPTPYDHS